LFAAVVLALLFVVAYSVRDIVPENRRKDDVLGIARSAEATSSVASASLESADTTSSTTRTSFKSTGYMTTLEESDITSSTLSSGDGFSTWIAQPTAVTLQAPSWATATTYRLDDGADSLYVAPIGLNTEGKHSLYYQSTSDRQVETLQAKEVWIDFTPPSTPGKVVFSEPTSDGFSFALGESKDAVSGVKSYDVTVTPESDGTAAAFEKEFDDSNGTVTGLRAGRYRLDIAAVDFAGNRSATKSLPVDVGLAAPKFVCRFDDSNVANDVALGKWITSAAGVRMTVSVESSAPAVTLKNTTLSGSLETTEATQTSYSSIPLAFTDEGSGKVVISATDIYGNDSKETSLTLAIDRTPPSRVGIVKATVEQAVSDSSKKNLKVSWQSSSDAVSGVKGYHIRIVSKDSGFSGVRETFVTGTSYTVPDVEDGTYAVTVAAEDNAGLIGSGIVVRSNFGQNDIIDNASASSNGVNISSTDNDRNSDSSDASSTALSDSDGAVSGGDGSNSSGTEVFGAVAGAAATTQATSKTMWDAFRQSLKNDWRLWIIGALGLLLLVSLTAYYLVSKRRAAREEMPQPASSPTSTEAFPKYFTIG